MWNSSLLSRYRPSVPDELDFSVWPPQPGPPEPTTVAEATERPERPPGRPWRVLYWVTFGVLFVRRTRREGSTDKSADEAIVEAAQRERREAR